ncbi:hypothetical protein NE237_020160 [Protea cynaroides]|uniref:Uncharacterized protein n=1 Tax=Protea cynaroides TaxID=273540 RepID=A0A9Q0H8W1_9MAGN|nr:hypothetical protein NE237_020160 [Protea cynaroides]
MADRKISQGKRRCERVMLLEGQSVVGGRLLAEDLSTTMVFMASRLLSADNKEICRHRHISSRSAGCDRESTVSGPGVSKGSSQGATMVFATATHAKISHVGVDRCQRVVFFQDKRYQMSQGKARHMVIGFFGKKSSEKEGPRQDPRSTGAHGSSSKIPGFKALRYARKSVLGG